MNSAKSKFAKIFGRISFPLWQRAVLFSVAYFVCAESAVRDITERKRAEEALRESEERLALVFNNTSDIMALYEVMPDGNCRLVTANRAFFDRAWSTGNEVEREDIIGKSYDELTRQIFQAGRRCASAAQNQNDASHPNWPDCALGRSQQDADRQDIFRAR